MDRIPKVIHYCWFGRGEKSKLIKKCIKSWEKYLPDYKIIEWNEDNFDINSNKFVKEAYEVKKYAFVSDYVRLYALYNNGGIYMDTDMEVKKSLNKFIKNTAFIGFEDNAYVSAGIIGTVKSNEMVKRLLECYDTRDFKMEDGTLNLETIVIIITNEFSKFGLVRKDKFQVIEEWDIYPQTYFYPIGCNGDKHFSKETYTIHHFSGSWISKEDKRKTEKYKRYLKRKDWLCKFMSERWAYIILDFKWILKNKIKKLMKATVN